MSDDEKQMVKNAITACCLQAEQTKGRRLTAIEVQVICDRFQSEFLSRLTFDKADAA